MARGDQKFEYGFDDIGNRTQTKAGGDALGGDLRLASYSANNTKNKFSIFPLPSSKDCIMQLPLEELDYQRRAVAAVGIFAGQVRNTFDNSKKNPGAQDATALAQALGGKSWSQFGH